MNLNKNYMSKYAIGKEYSYSTLKSMSKDNLIELLNIAQHNYEVANERLFNVTQYAEKLDQALDKACDIIIDLNDCINDASVKYPTCPFKYECGTFDGCIGDKEKWKKHLMKGDEE